MTQFLFELIDLSFSYLPTLPALRHVTLNIPEGSLISVIGSNGSGKSTLLQIVAGLIFPSKGQVLFSGQSVTEEALTKKDFVKFFRSHVGFVFQDSEAQLFCPSVFDELMFGPLQLELSEHEAKERTQSVLKLLEIDHLSDRSTLMLSGGEQKRVALGSVLTMNPNVLILDEPLGALDARTQSFMVELIMQLNDAGKTIMMATHDLGVVDELNADVVVLSEDHTVLATGSAAEILSNTELLLQANLIHEHKHHHGDAAHKHAHAHFLTHRHGE